MSFEEIWQVFCDVTGAGRHQVFLIDTLAVNIKHHGAPPVGLGKVFPIVNEQAAMRMSPTRLIRNPISRMRSGTDKVLMVSDRLDVGVNERVKMPKRV